jgi:hypothetical protein
MRPYYKRDILGTVLTAKAALRARFIKYELPEDFVADLRAGRQAITDAIMRTNTRARPGNYARGKAPAASNAPRSATSCSNIASAGSRSGAKGPACLQTDRKAPPTERWSLAGPRLIVHPLAWPVFQTRRRPYLV